jgi:hypothetical protein
MTNGHTNTAFHGIIYRIPGNERLPFSGREGVRNGVRTKNVRTLLKVLTARTAIIVRFTAYVARRTVYVIFRPLEAVSNKLVDTIL